MSLEGVYNSVILSPGVTDNPSGFLDSLIEQAAAYALEFTRLGESIDDYPDEDSNLDAAVARIVLHWYRQAGAEGATQVSIGDMSATWEIPAEATTILKRKRRTGWL